MAAAGLPLDMDSEEEDGGEWEDWRDEGTGEGGEEGEEEEDEEGEEEEDEETVCLLCDAVLPSPKAAFVHCKEEHSFDFLKLRADSRLDFYDTLRLINFIRARVALHECWSCEAKHDTQEALLEHLNTSKHVTLSRRLDEKQKGRESSNPAWKNDKYLRPFLENDPLLYGFDEEGGDNESEEFDVVDKTTALQELLDGSSGISMDRGSEVIPEPVQTKSLGADNLADLTKVFLSLGDGVREDLASPTDASGVSDFGESALPSSSGQGREVAEAGPGPDSKSTVVDQDRGSKQFSGMGTTVTKKKDRKDLKVTFAQVAEKEMRNANKDYFGSYSGFGIHREMLSDKVKHSNAEPENLIPFFTKMPYHDEYKTGSSQLVLEVAICGEKSEEPIRTDAYRDAIVGNPSLLKDAVVMDVGCGTGILSLFAAQAGASKVVAIDGSAKIASVASQVAKVNGFLKEEVDPNSGSKGRGVMTVVAGMIEDLDLSMPVPVQGVDVLVSEWMGYCLLFESMLPSVLHARDRWLKPGGSILPDTARMYIAGFAKGGTSLPFWEDVYGFNMRCVGEEVVQDATQSPIIDVVESKEVITNSCLIQAFDLATMKEDDVDFSAQFQLELSTSGTEKDIRKMPTPSIIDQTGETLSSGDVTWCYGLVIWFDTGFTDRFCKENPVLLTTSPHAPKTHWSQTLLTFREPIALCRLREAFERVDRQQIGTEVFPASSISGRISVARSHRHRSIDISLEISAVATGSLVRTWPVQMFDI